VACSRIKPSITFPLPQEQYKPKQLKQASDTELLMGIDPHGASSSIHKINTELICSQFIFSFEFGSNPIKNLFQ
jgi:hypothetical protein